MTTSRTMPTRFWSVANASANSCRQESISHAAAVLRAYRRGWRAVCQLSSGHCSVASLWRGRLAQATQGTSPDMGRAARVPIRGGVDVVSVKMEGWRWRRQTDLGWRGSLDGAPSTQGMAVKSGSLASCASVGGRLGKPSGSCSFAPPAGAGPGLPGDAAVDGICSPVDPLNRGRRASL